MTTAHVDETPGRGWRWSTQDAGVVIEQGLAYYATADAAEAAAVSAIGTNWPGTPTEGFASVDDAEAAGWHYVGSGGTEPAFGTDWDNVGTPWPAMAYRVREAGVVDLVGTVEAVALTSAVIFTLPAGYRPNEQAFMPMIRQRSGTKSGQLLVVNTGGDVLPSDSGASGDVIYVSGSFFIENAAP